MRRSSAKKPGFPGQTIMNHVDPEVETPEEELFRHEAIVVRLLLALPCLSQDRLAELSGIGQDLISYYQRGKLIPSPETLQRLAAAAGWPLPGRGDGAFLTTTAGVPSQPGRTRELGPKPRGTSRDATQNSSRSPADWAAKPRRTGVKPRKVLQNHARSVRSHTEIR